MFCKNCGKEIVDGAVFCPYCGANVNAPEPVAQPAKSGAQDNPVAIVGLVLAFIIPLAGLICSCIGYKKAKYEHPGDLLMKAMPTGNLPWRG